jgi:hypothetical protein
MFMEALIAIARITGEKKYLEPIPKALKYLKTCMLKDGRVARFYEFKTNKPLYMNTRYELTYDDSDTPGHYGWKQPAHFDEIEKELLAVQKGIPSAKAKPIRDVDVQRILKHLDTEGR